MSSAAHSLVPSPRKRAPRGWVVKRLPPAKTVAEVDWSKWYLTEEVDMGQSQEQNKVIWLLCGCMNELARERGWTNVEIGFDVFFGWVKSRPLVQLSPDVYLLDDPPSSGPEVHSYQTWKPGVNPPRFAVEIVSINWKKDLVDAPARYSDLGCSELVIFDPAKAGNSRGSRRALSIYRREGEGPLELVERSDGPVKSKELDAWLVVVVDDGKNRLRVARNAAGTNLVPTSDERAETEAAARQAESKRAEAAEARIAALEAELKKRSRG